ncbi:MAG: VOC family protein [candidate division WOR-3 bacterium]|nr:MAG: VOC family protein [candidate division WOR-3 bacterium]
MPRVVHFEISADDPERAVKFYTNVFGWTINKWKGPMDYWLLTTGKDEPGINGAIMKREQPLTGKDGMIGYTCTMDVDNVDNYIKKVEKNGGKVIQPKGAIPGVGWFAMCLDTEGNVFGLMREDPSAE